MSDLLKNKISNFEVPPPAAAWTNISAELNEHKAFLPLAEKMYNYEEQPPGAVWANIPFLLKADREPPVRTMRPMLVKLATAAAVLGVILIGSLYFMHEEKSAFTTTTVNERPIEPVKKQDLPDVEDITVSKPNVTASMPAMSFSSPRRVRTTIRERFERKKRILSASTVNPDYYDINKSMYDIGVQASLIRNENGDIIQAPALIRNGSSDEYISVTGPNGQQTRISAKFADVLLYLNKNENLQNEEWQRKFEDWRGKIMQTSFIPSSSNFLDILELKDFILKDNQQ